MRRPMADDDVTIEVPVTRQARATRIGVLDARGVFISDSELKKGDVIALMRDGSWRRGLGRVTGRGQLDLRGIIGPSEGDVVYRVEPE
jgi:hypothetical protein